MRHKKSGVRVFYIGRKWAKRHLPGLARINTQTNTHTHTHTNPIYSWLSHSLRPFTTFLRNTTVFWHPWPTNHTSTIVELVPWKHSTSHDGLCPLPFTPIVGDNPRGGGKTCTLFSGPFNPFPAHRKPCLIRICIDTHNLPTILRQKFGQTQKSVVWPWSLGYFSWTLHDEDIFHSLPTDTWPRYIFSMTTCHFRQFYTKHTYAKTLCTGHCIWRETSHWCACCRFFKHRKNAAYCM